MLTCFCSFLTKDVKGHFHTKRLCFVVSNTWMTTEEPITLTNFELVLVTCDFFAQGIIKSILA